MAITSSGARRVLVVDDDDHVRSLATLLLRHACYDLLAAGTPAEAIEVLHANPEIAAVLSDIVMPGMSGFDFSTEVKAFAPHVRFVFMSGFTEDQFRPPIADPFVAKPFGITALAEAIAAALS